MENEENGAYQEYQEDGQYAICGGVFQIYVKGEMIGVFCLSGWSHDMDYQLIVDAFEQFLNQKEK